MKAKEFWIQQYHYEDAISEKPQKDDGWIHVREVKPIEWEKVWSSLDEYFSSDECTHKWPGTVIKIQQLVDKQLAGEE